MDPCTKFIVLKREDAVKHLSTEQLRQLEDILKTVEQCRAAQGKKPSNNYWAVNQDEPYGPDVHRLIEWGEVNKRLIREASNFSPTILPQGIRRRFEEVK